jgi:hypothetical protein
MHAKMMKMLAGKKDLSDKEKKAKMDVASSLRDDMADHMKQKLAKPIKKVSVMADSDSNLKKGLDKAKELVQSGPMMDSDEDMMADGGEVDMDSDQDKLQSAQDSMRKAFGYAEGGEVENDANDLNDAEMEEPHEEQIHDRMSSPDEEETKYGDEQEDDSDEEENEFHGLDMHEVNDKLNKLMKMKSKMESK